MKNIYSLTISLCLSTPILAENFTINMWTVSPQGKINVFEPTFLKIKSGDSVAFIQKQKWHNSQSIKNSIPKGVQKWKSKLGDDITILFEKEGIYAYKCQPHISVGMAGLIQVGAPINKNAIKETLLKEFLPKVKNTIAKKELLDNLDNAK